MAAAEALRDAKRAARESHHDDDDRPSHPEINVNVHVGADASQQRAAVSAPEHPRVGDLIQQLPPRWRVFAIMLAVFGSFGTTNFIVSAIKTIGELLQLAHTREISPAPLPSQQHDK